MDKLLTGFSIKEFIIGGILFSAIKYSSDNISDIRISSMMAAFPIGLLSSLLISDKKIHIYSKSYTKSIFILLITSIMFYLMHYYTSLHRHLVLIISIFLWAIINYTVLKLS